MSRRLIISGGSRPIELMLVGTMIVGRDPACEISESTDPLLSRRHAAFIAESRDASVRDLGSRNGILVNGVKTAEARLRNGDVVQIGHLQVRYVDEVGPFRDVSVAADAAATKLLDPAVMVDIDATRKLPS
jgi:pSer/pThr/pTyr-binding forkhead associated (FHA) protein